MYRSSFVGLAIGALAIMAIGSGLPLPAAATTDAVAGDGLDPEWGVGIAVRHARIPFAGAEGYASDVVPLLYYEGERVFLDGIEGGIRMGRIRDWEFNALGRIRFFDKPRSSRGEVQSDVRDVGFQFRHGLSDSIALRFDVMSAGSGRHYFDAMMESRFGDDFLSARTRVGVRVKNSAFNDSYLGLDQEAIGSGADLRAAIDVRRHVSGNLYLLAGAAFVRLDDNARRSAFVRENYTWELSAGVGIFNSPGVRRRAVASMDPYLRASWGWATPSNLGEIIRFNGESDPGGNTMSSVFYGHPLTDRVFGIPLDVYLTGGLVGHHRSREQKRSVEYVVGIKAYYTVQWPVRVRFGVAEGLSYVSEITAVEGGELERKGFRPSKLLNYLDFSVDVNAGDLLRSPSLGRLWMGYGIHHRSGVFQSGSQFGEIHGGSNYHTVYLQWHF